MLHPLARPVEIDEPAVVHDAVDERGGELVVAEHDAPFGELDVGGDHQSSMRWRSPLSKVASLRLDACHRPEPPPGDAAQERRVPTELAKFVVGDGPWADDGNPFCQDEKQDSLQKCSD